VVLLSLFFAIHRHVCSASAQLSDIALVAYTAACRVVLPRVCDEDRVLVLVELTAAAVSMLAVSVSISDEPAAAAEVFCGRNARF